MGNSFVNSIFKKILSIEETSGYDLNNPRKFLIVRQHNQLGDMIAGFSVIRAIKETYPGSEITLIASPVNYQGMVKNKMIDRLFVFHKEKLINPEYYVSFSSLLKEHYDVVIVPVTVSISFTSNLIARLANAKVRIGPASLNGKKNLSSYFFDKRIKLDWQKHPDANVSEVILDIIKPFGITTNDLHSQIYFDEKDIKAAAEFRKEINAAKDDVVIGLHIGAGKPQNKWSIKKYTELAAILSERYKAKLYVTGSSPDKEVIEYFQRHLTVKAGYFLNRSINEIAALVSSSSLFISNDTGIMHVAGATGTPQISIFGPTNPFNWAPIGANKIFLKKSDLIDDITVEDVLEQCRILLNKEG